MPKILIGLPVYQRDWILPYWLRAIENQNIDMASLGFIFCVAPYEQDPNTHKLLQDFFSRHPELWCFDFILDKADDHRHHKDGIRIWENSAYLKMCRMRNSLLERATSLDPDYYFSLDSDILLEDSDTIIKLAERTEPGTAHAPLMYMKHYGDMYPSVMTWADSPGGRAKRNTGTYPIGEIFQSDIIMAAVMMSREVYKNARYHPHKQGEDLGWSHDCAMRGYRLFSSSDIYCPHIMHKSSENMRGIVGPGVLDVYLKYGDNRGPVKIVV